MAPSGRIPVGPFAQLVRGQRQQIINDTRRAAVVSSGWQQWRQLHLYKTARARTTHGMHKIIPFDWYRVAPPRESQHVVDVVESDIDDIILAKGISVEELYGRYVKPGQMLYLTQQIPKGTAENITKMKEEGLTKKYKRFATTRAHTRWVPVGNGYAGKQLGPLKQINMALSNPVEYTKLALDRAYQFVANGSPVEFQIRLKGNYAGKAKMKGKLGHRGSGDDDDGLEKWRWMHDHFPHLRPDFILKAMPEGTFFLIKPVNDSVLLKFVVSLEAEQMPKMDLSKRLQRVKDAVIAAKKNKGLNQDVGLGDDTEEKWGGE